MPCVYTTLWVDAHRCLPLSIYLNFHVLKDQKKTLANVFLFIIGRARVFVSRHRFAGLPCKTSAKVTKKDGTCKKTEAKVSKKREMAVDEPRFPRFVLTFLSPLLAEPVGYSDRLRVR